MPLLRSPVLLVVGNGLALDLHAHNPALAPWDPREPLTWAVPNPSDPSRRLIEDLPAAAGAVAGQRAREPGLSDFQAFDSLSLNGTMLDETSVYCQLRHYLALAYSEFQAVADPFIARADWNAGELLRRLAGSLLGVISYNYDVTLEGVLEAGRTPVQRIGVDGEPAGLPLFKPHGSIDFAPAANVIGGQLPSYPLWLTAELNDLPMQRLPRTNLRVPRYEADLVLPAERSRYGQFQWVKPGWDWLHQDGFGAATVVFWGLSYWPCDRKELTEIFMRTSRRADCVVINPKPDETHMARLEAHYSQPVRVYASAGDVLLDLK